MAIQNAAFGWVVRLARLALILFLGFVAMALVGTVSGLIVAALSEQSPLTLVFWVMGVLAALAAGLGAFVAFGIIQTIAAGEWHMSDVAGRLSRLESLEASQADSVKKLIELAILSDQAKSLLYRDAEIDAIREAVHEYMMRQDYGTAAGLIDAIEQKLGYGEIAAGLRQEVDASRKRTLGEQIDSAVARINEIIERHDWSRAYREAQRLQQLFPGNATAESMPSRVTRARNDHKRALLEAYGEAVKVNDIDKSIGLLKELDLYLTPQEAAALQESARGVFRTKLHNLGVQFAIFVSDEQWTDALATGEQIVREFPNSRMAQEVREKIDLLRIRAGQTGNAPRPQRPNLKGE